MSDFSLAPSDKIFKYDWTHTVGIGGTIYASRDSVSIKIHTPCCGDDSYGSSQLTCIKCGREMPYSSLVLWIYDEANWADEVTEAELPRAIVQWAEEWASKLFDPLTSSLVASEFCDLIFALRTHSEAWWSEEEEVKTTSEADGLWEEDRGQHLAACRAALTKLDLFSV